MSDRYQILTNSFYSKMDHHIRDYCRSIHYIIYPIKKYDLIKNYKVYFY